MTATITDPDEAASLFAKMKVHDPPPPQIGLQTQWQLRTLKDAYQKREPTEFVIDALLPESSLSILYGAPGSLKSMILADAAVCVAGGLDWLIQIPGESGGKTFKVKQRPVLWIDFDNGTRRTDERFDALSHSRNLPDSTPLYYVSMPTPWLNASNRNMVQELSNLINSIGAGMVIIDNLGLVTGDTDEITAEMATVMGNFRWLCEITKSALVIIHHQKKGGSGDNRKGELLRGHSSIEAALDLAIIVERVEGKDDITLTPTKTRGYRCVEQICATFTYQHRQDCYDLETARFFASTHETDVQKRDRKTVAALKDAIVELSEAKEKTNQDRVVKKAQEILSAEMPKNDVPGINILRNKLTSLVEQKHIIESTGQHNASIFSLPG